jgi:hypothetical protein
MQVSLGLRHLVGMLLVVLLGNGIALSQQPAAGTAAAGQSQLKWTPHRAATSTEPTASATSEDTASQSAATAAAAAIPATAVAPATTLPAIPPKTALAQPPASVGLPAGVPAVSTAQRRQASRPQTATPPRMRSTGQIGDWNSDNRVPGRFRDSAATSGQLALPSMTDLNLFRSPQGNTGRPVLAVEGTPRQAANAPAASPLGGGLAPRFSATASRPTGPRSERLAMNADGLPSVMARAPQAAAIDDGSVPGRLPATVTPSQTLPSPTVSESMTMSDDPSIVINTMPSEMTDYGPQGYGEYGAEGYDPSMSPADGGMWMGQYPSQLHVESFYDDPFACEEADGFLTCWPHDGRVCAWLRQFGKPYYGWHWYRDFTASAGVTSFQNQSNFGLLANNGTNEYLNWAMPFWNAFGIGWQLGGRAVQTNFQQPSLSNSQGTFQANSRQQTFVTTGFFTRAFEGRGLQGGAVYDYLSESYFEQVDVSQIRGELSYVWGYHEVGFWGAFNVLEQQGSLVPGLPTPGVASTVDLYTAFYRLHFGDANEARVWGGASGNGQGIVGAMIRAPLARSLAMEGNFTYLLPDKSQTYTLGGTSVTFSPSAWNLSANLVYYPAGRARRSLASPYRPLFDVADNGSMIRALARGQRTP